MSDIKYIEEKEIDVESLALELEEKHELKIEHDCKVYFVSWSDANEGWCYEVYQGEINFTDSEQYQEDGESIDGGLCTGTAKDAVGMMLGL